MHRRKLLHAAALAPLASGALVGSRLWAAPVAAAQTPRLLVVFLRGGYDALTLLVPRRGFYAEARPTIAVQGATPIDADWGLHPALNDALLPLVQRGELRFVPFAGTDDLSRSHFETQDSIELGQPLGARRDYGSGFLNRLAAHLGADAAPIAFTEQLPLTLRGPVPAANLSLRSAPGKGGTEKLQPAIAAMYRGHALQERVEEGFALRDTAARRMSLDNEMEAANRNAINARGFETEARRMGLMMRDTHALGFIDVGGWDTHVGQGGTQGPLANRLGELSRGLVACADALGPQAWRHTVIVVVSEFGRTVRENGAHGTDHGHGSVYWVLGGGLAAGPTVVGEQQPIEARTLLQQRDLPVLNDYRALLGGLAARQFGLDRSALAQVFPEAAPRDFGLL